MKSEVTYSDHCLVCGRFISPESDVIGCLDCNGWAARIAGEALWTHCDGSPIAEFSELEARVYSLARSILDSSVPAPVREDSLLYRCPGCLSAENLRMDAVIEGFLDPNDEDSDFDDLGNCAVAQNADPYTQCDCGYSGNRSEFATD